MRKGDETIMIRHIVLWKLKDEAMGNDRDANAAIIKERLEGLVGKIDGLELLKVNKNLAQGNYDLGLYSEVRDMDALKAYAVNPLHVEVKSFVKEVVSDMTAYDFEL